MKKILVLLALAFITTAGVPVIPAPEQSEPDKMVDLIKSSCEAEGFSFGWAYSVFYQEHLGIKNVNVPCSHHRTAHGVGGLLLRTAREEAGFKGPEITLDDYRVSIPLCVKYLARLDGFYHGDKKKVISHYITGKKYNVMFYFRVKRIFDACCFRD